MTRLHIYSVLGLLIWLIPLPGNSQTGSKRIPQSRPLIQETKTDSDTLLQEASRERLELPEVVVFGKDLSIRKPEKKITFSRRISVQKFQLVFPRFVPEPSSFSPPARHPDFEKNNQNRSSVFEASFGTYNSGRFGLDHWQQDSLWSLLLSADYERSDGQFKNSQFENWHGKTYLRYHLQPEIDLVGKISYNSQTFGLWADSTHTRKLDHLSLEGGIQSQPFADTRFWLLLGEERLPLSQKPERGPAFAASQSVHRERNRFLNAGISVDLSAWVLEFSGNVFGNTVQLYQNGHAVSDSAGNPLGLYQNALSRFDIRARHEFKLNNRLELGVTYFFYKSGLGEEKKSRTVPYLKLTAQPTPSLGVTVTYNPTLDLRTYGRLMDFNRFLDLSSYSDPLSDIKHAIEVKGEWQITTGKSIQAIYTYKSIENYFSYQPGTGSHLFHLFSIPKAHLSFLDVLFTMDWGTNLRLTTGFRSSFSGIDQLAGQDGPVVSFDIPYIEDLSWPLTLGYSLNKNIRLIIESRYFGSRLLRNDEIHRAKSFWLLNARINYDFGHFCVFIEGKNLFNRSYFVWDGYPEMGVNFHIGFTGHF